MTREEFQREHGIIGQSVGITEIVDIIRQVAPTDLTVLITGESGVGKEVIAKAIHAASKRASKPMISVNAGAIPEGILESELFGHEKGSFTGATETRKGYFELADQGSLLLDEIGELPLATQVKFLRVLESGEYMRVGSAVPRKTDVRAIAATNKNLESEVHNGRFREDLYFRLRSINIPIPPLRERREDIPLLAKEFLRAVGAKNGIPINGITDEAMELLRQYDWPGNVRELKNVLESMVVVEGGKKIDETIVRKFIRGVSGNGHNYLPVSTRKTPEQAERELIYRALLEVKSDILDIKRMLSHDGVSGAFETHRGIPTNVIEADVASEPHESSDHVSLNDMERKLIASALEHHKGNRRLASKQLKISERTLYRKIKEYGLEY